MTIPQDPSAAGLAGFNQAAAAATAKLSTAVTSASQHSTLPEPKGYRGKQHRIGSHPAVILVSEERTAGQAGE